MAIDCYLEVVTKNSGAIKGESTDAAFPDQIQILSWSHKVANTADSSGADQSSNAPDFDDMEFTAPTSAASTGLMHATASGAPIKQATLSCRKSDGGKAIIFLQIRLTEAFISSFKVGHADGGNRPIDEFTIHYGKMEIAYARQKADGSAEPARLASWDLDKNQPVSNTTLGKK